MTLPAVQRGPWVDWSPCSSPPEPPSVLRARSDCGGRLFTAKLAVVVDYLSHQLRDDRPRHTLQRSEARSRGSVASTVGWVQRFKGLDRSSSLPTVRTVIPLRRLPPRRSWFQSPVPRVKRRKRRNGFRQSSADWETAAACVKMQTESSVLIRPLIATPAQVVSRS